MLTDCCYRLGSVTAVAFSPPARPMHWKRLTGTAGSRGAILWSTASADAIHGAVTATTPFPARTLTTTYIRVAITERRVSIPSPFSELVTMISGNAAGCLDKAACTCAIVSSRVALFTLSAFVSTT